MKLMSVVALATSPISSSASARRRISSSLRSIGSGETVELYSVNWTLLVMPSSVNGVTVTSFCPTRASRVVWSACFCASVTSCGAAYRNGAKFGLGSSPELFEKSNSGPSDNAADVLRNDVVRSVSAVA